MDWNATTSSDDEELNIRRSDFPRDFAFGVATAAVQVEGAAKEGGKGPNIWDYFIQEYPDRIQDHSNNLHAIDHYNRYKDDVKLIKDLGVNWYRFSISWTRILPEGSLSGGVNQEGIDHYNDLINELIKNGITPFVTLLHFDPPQTLQNKYGGPLDQLFVNDFKDYAELCFKLFGDRVKHWITINEPFIIAVFGHDLGEIAPGRCSFGQFKCHEGNSSTEPYIVTHNVLLAHAAVVKLYRDKFQQGGEIGICTVGIFAEPYTEAQKDKAAARRIIDFGIGWIMEPLVFGDYPKIMRDLVKQRLPCFTQEEKNLIKGSFDFIGLNYYTTSYAKSVPLNPNAPPHFITDALAVQLVEKGGIPIGPQAEGSPFIYTYPVGLEKLLNFMKDNYDSPKIYIAENGITEANKKNVKLEEALFDPHRIDSILRHLYRIHNAIKNGVNVKGYMYWTPFDDFELEGGYIPRFGLYYTDYNNNLTRQCIELDLGLKNGTASCDEEELNIKRSDFPSDFAFGVATAAGQIEGAANEGGRGPSIWDNFTQEYPGFWTTLTISMELIIIKPIQEGSLSGGLNQEGIDHYNDLINELIKNGITPFVTLLHFDSPQALQDKYGGALNRLFVDDFKNYAELCFKLYGDRVKYWLTINEPFIVAEFGYDIGQSAPGRCSNRYLKCKEGNSSTEPYIVTHNHLLAHSVVVKLYRDKFQGKQRGEIGIGTLGIFAEPYSESQEDIAAARRYVDFCLGWIMEPLVFGDYPKIMRDLVKERLPYFTQQEKNLIKGSFDFIGFNYYTARYVKSVPPNTDQPPHFLTDALAEELVEKDGIPIGPPAEGSPYLNSYPVGLEKLLNFMKDNYNSPKIYIAENGISEANKENVKLEEALFDPHRIDSILSHLYRIHNAIKNIVNVKSYMYWTPFDDFEWQQGYVPRFGLYYTDYNNNFKRIPKLSAKWYRNFLKGSNSQSYSI
ncbi:beta-glucosidase 24-like [Senna tora]|uniref:Beta-glucosidase 24-like n=1 Tax=Senna tora TaxID=362788 RepID=A0A834WWL0_9FABA|nr:beta-glucosidase 24-like [Senna tora]